ncbi:MAG: mechanosensitive ion channel domain-containing protein [Pseudomonadota bacterium]
MDFLLRRIAAFIVLLFWALPLQAQEDAFFTVDGLNPGLGAPPDAVDRRTPRTALDTFLSAADAGDWTVAAHVLDLRDVDEAAQAVDGPILARQLHAILERKAVFDWAGLRQRPDALQTIGGRQQAQAGEPRRSLLIRELALSPVPAAILLNRLKPGEDAAPVWVFPQETVADIPALYREYGPSPWEARLPPWMLAHGPWNLMWWELLGLPLLIGAAAFLGWVTYRTIDRARRSADRGIVRGAFHAIRWPAVIAVVTAMVSLVMEHVFVFSGEIDTILSPLIAVGYVTAVLMLAMGAMDALLDNTLSPADDVDLIDSEREEARATATKLNATKRILSVAIFLIGAGIVLSTADVFRGLGLSLLASAGAMTVVLGFAARSVLANILSSLQIALNQSARVGDRIQWKGYLCYVERIHLTYVQLRDWDDTRVVVPVEEFVSETFVNWSLADPKMLKIIKFKLTPETDLDALRDAFREIVERVKGDDEVGETIADPEEAAMNVTGQDVFGIDVWFSLPCSSPNTSWTAACTVREELVRAMRDIAERTGRPVFPEADAAEAA